MIPYTKTVTTWKLTPKSTTKRNRPHRCGRGRKPRRTEAGRRRDDDYIHRRDAAAAEAGPAAPVTDESGVTTETTVEEIWEVVENSGSTEPQVVGYRVTTTRKGADGQLLSSKSDSVYGTITITKTVTQPMQQDTTDSVQTVSETVNRGSTGRPCIPRPQP